jgi:LmbE family N-acetylglucosaminyl deacetylase
MTPRKVLVVAAHPDDEILGCGAAMARHAREGARVWTLILGEGVTSRRGLSAAGRRKALKELHATATKANRAVGAERVILSKFPDNRFDSVARLELAQAIEAVAAELKPELVYTHGAYDLNVDHQETCEAAKAAFRPLPGSTVAELRLFEVPSATEWRFDAARAFHPDTFVDVSATLESKLAALRAYAAEMRPFPHPRSPEYVRALAAVRGGQSGLKAAEAFVTVRRVVA